ncbi:MAG: CopD family protein [Planctomycetota bacterium]
MQTLSRGRSTAVTAAFLCFGLALDGGFSPVGAQASAGGTLAEAATVPAFVPVLVRLLLDVSATALLGLVAFRWLILEGVRTAPWYALFAFPALRRLLGVGWVVTTLVLVLLPLRLGLQATRLFGSDALSRTGVLLGTAWGTSWWIHLTGAVLLAVGLLVAGSQGRRPGWWLIAVAALLLAAVPGLSGHASGTDRYRTLMILNNAVHVIAAGTWVGGLLAVVVIGLPALREANAPSQLGGGLTALATLVARFSAVAVIAVAVLTLTGIVNARVILGSWQVLFGTFYGWTLMWKVGLVGLTGLLGLYHWLVVRPELEDGLGSDRLRPTALVELALALVVLGTTALLATTSPLGEP